MIAEIGTPSGSSTWRDSAGLFRMGAVKRLFACAAFSPDDGLNGLLSQSVRPSGAFSLNPSHQTSPSVVSPTLVKSVSRSTIRMAMGFDWGLVLGATPK